MTKSHAAGDLDGGENREHGGRWNSPGRAVLYAAENLALAALECLANLPMDERRYLPKMVAVGIDIPDETGLVIAREELEAHCQGRRGEEWCRAIGDRWLDEARHLVLVAPSIIVPREHNVMLNPAHPAMADVRIATLEPYTFDGRLIRAEG